MKTHLFFILCICFIHSISSQEEDGVVSLTLPVRNSLTFNRYVINPTFSFVREQTKYISIYNKREWVQFEDAPLTYLASYSGRFSENIGAGIGLFQQNYGVLTTFGGVLNFAYNARLTRDHNLTFGLSIGAYKSGVNTSNVVTNFEDPSLQNVPSNFLLIANPGINYGTEFLDFGVSINNLVVYNVESSSMIEDNPEQGIQAHIMYTGYMDSRGFFDESKFSGIVRSEFKKDETIISAIAMVTVPKGIWGQVGYNTVFGPSAGLGINITPQIAIEYNYETAVGNLNNFGPSHDITLAYRFENKDNYYYSGDDEVSGLFSVGNKRRRVAKVSKPRTNTNSKLSAEAKAEKAELESIKLAEQNAKKEAEALALLLAEQKAEQLAEQKAKEEADAKTKQLAEQKAKEEADAKAKLLAEQKAKEEADAKAKLLAQQKAREEADAKAKLLAEQKAKADADAKAKLLAQQKAKEEADAKAKLLAEQKAKADADAKAILLAQQLAKTEADANVKKLTEDKAKAEADAQAILMAEQKAQEEKEQINNPKDDLGKSMLSLDKLTDSSKVKQDELLKNFTDIIEIKNKDLKDLKEENDLSEKGIAVQPKPFKSLTAENNKLRAIKSDLDNVIKIRSDEIAELKSLYEERTIIGDTLTNDVVNLYYKKKIKRLESEQFKAIQARSQLETRLEDIRIATEFERRRRIKRAGFDNEEERYSQDRATLTNIKNTTSLSSTPLKESDFDFGEAQGNNIKILKKINNVSNGYYLILAVHSNKDRRNEFVKKVVASGRKDIDFFYDVTTSKYYIYYNKFDSIEQANEALKAKGNRPYNKKMSLVKIEN